MRIIAGRYKGLPISAPRNIRPTKDNVREAIFNVMAGYIKGKRILDLFAGSGGLGIEALSRGAGYVLFVDNSKAATKVIEKNLKKLAPEDIEKTRVLTKDMQLAIRLLSKREEKFDIIFLDPPYYKNWIKKCLKSLYVYDILLNSGLVVAEHFKKDIIPADLEVFELIRQLTYGDTIISIYKKSYKL